MNSVSKESINDAAKAIGANERKRFFEVPMTLAEKARVAGVCPPTPVKTPPPPPFPGQPVATPVPSKNASFVSAFRKKAGIKVQSTLPSAVTLNNEWAVREGWGIVDATSWRSICEKAKYAQDDVEGDSILELLLETIELAAHCETHPIGIMNFARTSFGQKSWDIDSAHYLREHLLDDGEKAPVQEDQPQHAETTCVDVDDDDDDNDAVDKGWKRGRYEGPTQPYDSE